MLNVKNILQHIVDPMEQCLWKNPKTKQNTYLCKDIELACLHGKVRNPNKQVPAKGGVR